MSLAACITTALGSVAVLVDRPQNMHQEFAATFVYCTCMACHFVLYVWLQSLWYRMPAICCERNHSVAVTVTGSRTAVNHEPNRQRCPWLLADDLGHLALPEFICVSAASGGADSRM
jgi:hypothetical protein